MWFNAFSLENVRGFQATGKIDLAKNINIFIGANSAGKSTILSAFLKIQPDDAIRSSLITNDGVVKLYCDNDFKSIFKFIGHNVSTSTLSNIEPIVTIQTGTGIRLGDIDASPFYVNGIPLNTSLSVSGFPSTEPQNIIYPFLSQRKNGNYSEQYNESSVNKVGGYSNGLYAKIKRLSDVYEEGHEDFIAAVQEIFGYPISTKPTQQGVTAGYKVSKDKFISIPEMGEGTPNLLNLIVDLCVAKNKIFIIEEPENDIHPKALKVLLRLIENSSSRNQFFISTHSNIVVKYLGGVNRSKTFEVKMVIGADKRPQSSVREISPNPEERRTVLENLGYDFYDLGFWKGWLFLEEASAESIVRDVLILLLLPELNGKLRTYSAKGRDAIKERFADFNNLFVFLHLEANYRNRAWVIIDAGEKEEAVIQMLKDRYPTDKTGWRESQFQQFSEHDFERYYPDAFKAEVERVLAITNKDEKRREKGALAKKVVQWAQANRDEARTAFEHSAADVIAKLKAIAQELLGDG